MSIARFDLWRDADGDLPARVAGQDGAPASLLGSVA